MVKTDRNRYLRTALALVGLTLYSGFTRSSLFGRPVGLGTPDRCITYRTTCWVSTPHWVSSCWSPAATHSHTLAGGFATFVSSAHRDDYDRAIAFLTRLFKVLARHFVSAK
jgi:hypothetical protein